MLKFKEFNMEVKNLKLIARTEEDLRVISAHLQDSIGSVSDIASLKKIKFFLCNLIDLCGKMLKRVYLEKIKESELF